MTQPNENHILQLMKPDLPEYDFSELMQSPMYNQPTVEELQAEIDRLNARVKELEESLYLHHKSYFY